MLNPKSYLEFSPDGTEVKIILNENYESEPFDTRIETIRELIYLTQEGDVSFEDYLEMHNQLWSAEEFPWVSEKDVIELTEADLVLAQGFTESFMLAVTKVQNLEELQDLPEEEDPENPILIICTCNECTGKIHGHILTKHGLVWKIIHSKASGYFIIESLFNSNLMDKKDIAILSKQIEESSFPLFDPD